MGDIHRREVLAAGAACAFGSPALAAARLRDAARDAWLFTLPLVEIARVRHERASTVGLNRLVGSGRLLDHTARSVTTPNNDTLYGTAQLDLSAGPVKLVVPPCRERYLSVALMDAYSDNFAVLGTRATPDGGEFRLTGPGEGSTSVKGGDIRAPTPHVWCLVRTLVTGPEDAAAAMQLARSVRLEAPPAAAPPPASPARDAPWREYFAGASRLLALNPPRPQDRGQQAVLKAVGLGTTFDPGRFSAAEAVEIEAGVAEAQRISREGFTGGRFRGGWSYAKPNIGDFGRDYRYRAAVALSGLAALPAKEAMYMRAQGAGDGVFPAGTESRLHFPAGATPPVDAFWSLSLYEATDDGQFYFAANPLRRFAIGDRTPGLKTNPDGSLDIWIGHADPGPERRSNWLPAPDRPHALVMRAYLPKAALREGRYRLPAVRPA